MFSENWLLLLGGGLCSGLLAGLLGIGGGVILVPFLITLQHPYAQAVATSSLAIVMTSVSGSFQNWRMGYLKFKPVLLLGIPGIFTAILGAYLVSHTPKYVLEAGFGCLLLSNIYLSYWRKQIITHQDEIPPQPVDPILAQILTGSITGSLAGLFGVGGGVILIPLQMLLLRQEIKTAIQTSLGVIMMTSIAACVGHSLDGNVLWLEGITLGIGGLVGAQVSTRYLPHLPEQFVKLFFNSFLLVISIYFFAQAFNTYSLRN